MNARTEKTAESTVIPPIAIPDSHSRAFLRDAGLIRRRAILRRSHAGRALASSSFRFSTAGYYRAARGGTGFSSASWRLTAGHAGCGHPGDCRVLLGDLQRDDSPAVPVTGFLRKPLPFAGPLMVTVIALLSERLVTSSWVNDLGLLPGTRWGHHGAAVAERDWRPARER